ncbi:TetR/AcrR family transcriptional regulator [Variovorax saccharolyticus]|uniref:TetR/AcrR family transcriptional regulator n=1 Tax=Variovorax saccharolyticus TaxID=3053516 RepID=UPI002578FE36|nr:TetR/AcrR family transcriptional regulator [Variovorax sp. J22R187]MDM0021388.1 TetR/AcrR family transcriptional regulator [Variovorax sp. J22R187]
MPVAQKSPAPAAANKAAKSAPSAKASRSRKSPEPVRPYHHGALPEALLAAAESVLVRDGLAGLALRAIAREAGVSHTAPKHHFGDTTGLLSQLAAVGMRRLRDAMSRALEGGGDRYRRSRNIAHAYVHFAYDHPALFRLMFSNDRIDMRNPVLAEATAGAMRVLADMQVGEASGETAPPRLVGAEALEAAADWGYVHGLAMLLIDRRMNGLIRAMPEYDTPIELVDAVLRRVYLGVDDEAA